MDTINDAITFMLIIIPIGTLARVVYCFIVMAMDGDEEQTYKVRIRNALIFCVAAECIVGLISLFKSYF
ncbi:MAG: hypothetical protein VB064_02305 [Oscillospiraceae bacterium]|nr:hypothetical protein [Oscillospiraceae bacterium]